MNAKLGAEFGKGKARGSVFKANLPLILLCFLSHDRIWPCELSASDTEGTEQSNVG